MNFFDFFVLVIIVPVFIITIVGLFISVRLTNDAKRKKEKIKVFVPIIAISGIVILFHLAVYLIFKLNI